MIGRRRKLLKDMGGNMAIEVSAALSGSGFEEASVTMLNEQLAQEALAQEVMWYKPKGLEPSSNLPPTFLEPWKIPGSFSDPPRCGMR